MNRAFIILIALSLSGCFADQEQLVASREFDAFAKLPARTSRNWCLHWRLYTVCMKANGYDWNLIDK